MHIHLSYWNQSCKYELMTLHNHPCHIHKFLDTNQPLCTTIHIRAFLKPAQSNSKLCILEPATMVASGFSKHTQLKSEMAFTCFAIKSTEHCWTWHETSTSRDTPILDPTHSMVTANCVFQKRIFTQALQLPHMKQHSKCFKHQLGLKWTQAWIKKWSQFSTANQQWLLNHGSTFIASWLISASACSTTDGFRLNLLVWSYISLMISLSGGVNNLVRDNSNTQNSRRALCNGSLSYHHSESQVQNFRINWYLNNTHIIHDNCWSWNTGTYQQMLNEFHHPHRNWDSIITILKTACRSAVNTITVSGNIHQHVIHCLLTGMMLSEIGAISCPIPHKDLNCNSWMSKL